MNLHHAFGFLCEPPSHGIGSNKLPKIFKAISEMRKCNYSESTIETYSRRLATLRKHCDLDSPNMTVAKIDEIVKFQVNITLQKINYS